MIGLPAAIGTLTFQSTIRAEGAHRQLANPPACLESSSANEYSPLEPNCLPLPYRVSQIFGCIKLWAGHSFHKDPSRSRQLSFGNKSPSRLLPEIRFHRGLE